MTALATNNPCNLLSKSENDDIFTKLKTNTTASVMSIAEIYMTKPPSHDSWTLFKTGVIILLRDANRRSYFINVYLLDDNSMIWEQELYDEFSFKMPKPHFMTFEAQDCVIGLNFVNENEAKSFSQILSNKLNQREARRKELEKRIQTNKSATYKKINPFKKMTTRIKGKKPTKQPIVISGPSEFRHVSHLGFDPNKGFDKSALGGDWTKLFESLGVTDKELTDKTTSNLIYQYVQEHGGIQNIVKAINTTEKASTGVPPPSVPSRKLADSQKSTSQESLSSAIPPPPPIISNTTAVAPPPLPPAANKEISTSREQLDSSSSLGDRGNLLSQIQKGVTLRKAPADQSNTPSQSKHVDQGILGGLQLSLDKIRANIKYDEDDDDDDENDDADDW